MSLVSTLLTLPILALVSIPLILSAWVTISLALVTLTLRLTVIYIQLSYALLVNFFTVPKTTLSLLTFTASQPTSPVAGRSRRNSGYGLVQSSRNKDSLTAWALNEIHENIAMRQRKKYARSMVEAHHLSTTSYYDSLVSGYEGHDFEGVGGWRPYHNLSRAKSRGSQPLSEKPFRAQSPSSVQNNPTDDMNLDTDVDADERAWLSINHRLELPSQIVTLSTSSAATSNATSPIQMGHLDFRNGFHSNAPVSARHNSNSGRPRHHQRSHTTSSLTTTNPRTGNGLYLSISARPGPNEHNSREYGHHMSPITSRMNPFMTPQPSHIQIQRRQHTYTPSTSTTHVNGHRYGSSEGLGSSLIGGSAGGSPVNSNGGYFALQRPRTLHTPIPPNMGNSTSSGHTTPISMEDRDVSSPQLARLMAHHPTSVRHRRRSISGPHSRADIIE